MRRVLGCVLVGLVILHCVAATPEEELFRGCRTASLPTVKLALLSGADVNALDAAGMGALHLSARHAEMLSYLLDNGALVDRRDSEGCTPFLASVEAGVRQAAAVLLDRGADLYAQGRKGQTALLLAVLNEDPAMARFLLERGFSVDHRDPTDGQTALHAAARRGNPEAVSLLLSLGAAPQVRDGEGMSALDLARAAGNAGCIERLAEVSLASGAVQPSAQPVGHQSSDLHLHALDVMAYDIAANSKDFLYLAGPYGTLTRVDFGAPTPLLPVRIQSVAVSYDDVLYYTTQAKELYRFTYTDPRPLRLDALALDVASGSGETAWFVDAQSRLCRWDGNGVVAYPAVSASRVAVGPDGLVWFVSPSGATGTFRPPSEVRALGGDAVDVAAGSGGGLFRWDGGGWNLVKEDAEAVRITVTADGVPFVVTRANRVAWIDESPDQSTASSPEPESPATGVFHADGEVVQLHRAAEGPALNVIVMGDGYTRADLELGADYDRETGKLADYLLALPPFSYFRDRINVWVAYAQSRERGADSTPETDDRDTALGATYYTGGTEQRVLTVQNREALERYASRVGSPRDLLLVSVNDSRYGGTGSALVSVCSRDPESASLMAHEIGHSFAQLGDEYAWTGDPHPPAIENALSYPNLDLTGDLTRIRWRHLIGRPKFEKVGALEGAYYREAGVWRPQEECLMRHHTTATRYCAVCEEAIYGRICEKLGIRYSLEDFVRAYQP